MRTKKNKPKLNASAVVFDAAEHTYSLDGKQLKGITGLIRRRLFPDKYAGIDEATMQAAAERGKAVHALCQFEDEVQVASAHDNAEYAEAAHAYTELRETAGYLPVANEYIVSDDKEYASPIDCVWVGMDGGITLADIKTTYELDKEMLSWQLSVYAYLFERQNKGLVVTSLKGVWLPFRKGAFEGTHACVVEIERKSKEEVEHLLYDLDTPMVAVTASVPALVTEEYIAKYISAVNILKKAEEEKKIFTEALQAAMEKHGVKTWDAGIIRATYTEVGTRTTFDAKAFAADHPELHSKYCKESKTKARITITIRNNE